VTASPLERAAWPLERLGEAVSVLARAAGLPVRAGSPGRVPSLLDNDALGAWVEAAGLTLGVEMNELLALGQEIAPTLARAAPAVLRIRQGSAVRVVAVLRADARMAVALGSSGERVSMPLSALVEAVRGEIRPEIAERVDRLLDRTGVTGKRRESARAALFDRMLSGWHLGLGWSLELPPSAPFARQLRDAGAFSGAIVTLLMRLAQQALGIAGWWLIGRGALEGQIARGWLLAWALVLLSAVPVQVLATWAQGTTTLAFAVRLKRRLLHGALQLAPEEVRSEGSGQLLGRVIESSALEALVTNGGLAVLPALAEIVVAMLVLLLAPGGTLMALAFGACVVLCIPLSMHIGQRIAAWSRVRLDMTQDLVERMIGHRTRLAQEPPERRHVFEDQQLARYAERSTSLDQASAWLQGLMPRAWMVLGVVALAPSFVSGTTTDSGLAVAAGGLVLGWRALAHLGAGVTAILRARAAWEQTRPLFVAGGREERTARQRGLRRDRPIPRGSSRCATCTSATPAVTSPYCAG
jgi:ATP-binding cassette subfamily B protein